MIRKHSAANGIRRKQFIQKEYQQPEKFWKLVSYQNHELISNASLTSTLNVEGHRADLVILKLPVRKPLSMVGPVSTRSGDIAMAAELALPHRLQKGPF